MIDFSDRILDLTIGDHGEFKLTWLVAMDCYNFNDTFLLLLNAMSAITIHQLETDIAQQLEQRAAQNGRTIELEIKAILKSVLAPKKPRNIDLTTATNRRFADFGDFELHEIPRELILQK